MARAEFFLARHNPTSIIILYIIHLTSEIPKFLIQNVVVILWVLRICNAMKMENALAKLVLVNLMKMATSTAENVIPASQLILDLQIVKVKYN